MEISLSFDELCHIRKVLTKNDLDYLLFDKQLYDEVSRGKICFSCRKTKFNLFTWGSKCRICQQRICKKCMRNAQLKNSQIAQVPLAKLCPRKFEHSNTSNSNSSICSRSTNEDEDDFSDNQSEQLPKDETVISKLKNEMISNKSISQFDICVDCYDLMVSLKINVRNTDVFDEEMNKKSEGNQVPLAETISMNSLEHISRINETSIKSPFITKFTLSHHSTPTPQAPVPPASPTDYKRDGLFLKNFDSNSDSPRNRLTLDLKPFYTTFTP